MSLQVVHQRGWVAFQRVSTQIVTRFLSGLFVICLLEITASSLSDASDTVKQSIRNSVSSAGASDRVIDSYERRIEAFRKEIDSLTSTLESERNASSEMQMKLTELQSRKGTLRAKKQMMETWKNATFVVASDRTAYGVQVKAPGTFQCLARAELNEGEMVKQIANRFSIPYIQKNNSEFANACLSVRESEVFPLEATSFLQEYWKVRNYLPMKAGEKYPMLSFRDQTISNVRVGYLTKVRGSELEFISLDGKKELVGRDRMESGSVLVGSRDELLAEPSVNLVDVAALEIARTLSAVTTDPSYQCVTISVNVDELEEALKLSKTLDNSRNDQLFDLLARLNHEKYVPDQRKDPTRVLRQYSMVLHDELSQRLVHLGVPVGNREDLSALIDERELAQSTHFDKHRYKAMSSASHVVTASVGKPEYGGKFRISIRLNELDSAHTLLEFNADIGKPNASFPNSYFLQNGQLVLLSDKNFDSKEHLDNRPRPIRIAAWDDTPIEPRLGTVIKYGSGARYYDLFSSQSQAGTRGRFKTEFISDNNIESVPRNQTLRWLAWQLAEATLPTAGRVCSIDGDRIEVNIGSNHGVTTGATFRMLRNSSSYGQTNEILPFQVKADTVNPNSTIATLQLDGLSELWGDMRPQLEDVALVRGIGDSVIKVEGPVYSGALIPKQEAEKINAVFKNPLQVGRINATMAGLNQQMTAKIVQALQTNGVTNIGINPPNATHILSAITSPLQASPDCERFAMQYSVRSARDNRVLKVLPTFIISVKEMNQWQP